MESFGLTPTPSPQSGGPPLWQGDKRRVQTRHIVYALNGRPYRNIVIILTDRLKNCGSSDSLVKVCPSRRDVAQPGRVLASGARGRRFKSSHPDQSKSVAAIKNDAYCCFFFIAHTIFPLCHWPPFFQLVMNRFRQLRFRLRSCAHSVVGDFNRWFYAKWGKRKWNND